MYEETDDECRCFFTNIKEFLKDHNDCMETNYKTISEFNEGEPHRILTEINLN